MYRRQGSRPSPRKRNAKKQNGCLQKTYTQLRKKEKLKAKEKRKDPSECRVPRIVKRGKKALLSDQRKEIEENIERDRLEISSRILEIQGNTSCKDGHNKGQK